MSASAVVILLGATWLAIGVVLSLVMGRRGHFPFGWGVLGAMLGPLAIVAALGTARHEDEEPPAVIAQARSYGGPVDVVVGIDGSPECRLAVERVVALLGPRLGRLTFATVVPFDDLPDHTAGAIAALEGEVRSSGVRLAGLQLLHGQPARALGEFASEGGYGLLVVGSRGTGLSKTLLGSTAGALAAGCPVPVLMVSDSRQAGSAAA